MEALNSLYFKHFALQGYIPPVNLPHKVNTFEKFSLSLAPFVRQLSTKPEP